MGTLLFLLACAAKPVFPVQPPPALTGELAVSAPVQSQLDAFLAEMLPQARRLVASKGEDEEAYLMTVAAAMSRMGDPGSQLRASMRRFVSENRKPDERFPLAAMALRLRAGGGFPHHDHLNYNGVIIVRHVPEVHLKIARLISQL